MQVNITTELKTEILSEIVQHIPYKVTKQTKDSVVFSANEASNNLIRIDDNGTLYIRVLNTYGKCEEMTTNIHNMGIHDCIDAAVYFINEIKHKRIQSIADKMSNIPNCQITRIGQNSFNFEYQNNKDGYIHIKNNGNSEINIVDGNGIYHFIENNPKPLDDDFIVDKIKTILFYKKNAVQHSLKNSQKSCEHNEKK